YSVVSCGQRFEPKTHCEYDKYLCQHAHCPPCFLRHPSCHGLPEGLNPWPGKEGTPFFLVCRDGRVRYSGQCPDTPTSHQMFDPYKNVCVEKYHHDNSD
uniref:Chitin-binding type-2 domain-containing protein n=2 Tax=Magallana gigas TaxID=29159 RepID=A0A8W8LYV4_MAGGI